MEKVYLMAKDLSKDTVEVLAVLTSEIDAVNLCKRLNEKKDKNENYIFGFTDCPKFWRGQ